MNMYVYVIVCLSNPTLCIAKHWSVERPHNKCFIKPKHNIIETRFEHLKVINYRVVLGTYLNIKFQTRWNHFKIWQTNSWLLNISTYFQNLGYFVSQKFMLPSDILVQVVDRPKEIRLQINVFPLTNSLPVFQKKILKKWNNVLSNLMVKIGLYSEFLIQLYLILHG